MIPRFSAAVDGVEVLDRAYNRVQEQISDFRFIWPNVAKEFYAIEREQFNSEGSHGASGKWKPLSPAYKRWKDKHAPGEPILRLYHPLVESLTSHDAAGSVYQLDPDQMIIGSKVEYATAHQRGGGRLPARPPISLTEEDKRRLQKAIQLPLVAFVRRQGFNVLEKAA